VTFLCLKGVDFAGNCRSVIPSLCACDVGELSVGSVISCVTYLLCMCMNWCQQWCHPSAGCKQHQGRTRMTVLHQISKDTVGLTFHSDWGDVVKRGHAIDSHCLCILDDDHIIYVYHNVFHYAMIYLLQCFRNTSYLWWSGVCDTCFLLHRVFVMERGVWYLRVRLRSRSTTSNLSHD